MVFSYGACVSSTFVFRPSRRANESVYNELMEVLPAFSLFPDSVPERIFERSAVACDICKRPRGLIYTGPQYSESPATDDLRICPWCIADGSAAERGITFNDSTIYPHFDATLDCD
ncbi:MAG TPA: CbrC family protein [Phycisphaerae bacterium]|nr:CbrC family protein [Phycisphaerae bacterium]